MMAKTFTFSALLTILGAAGAAGAAVAVTAASTAASDRPNIIFILTDDQDLLMDSMQALPAMTRLLPQSLDNHFVNTPVCCPSRATFLSGRYAHNNRCKGYRGAGCMHMNTTIAENPEWIDLSFGKPIQDAGYATGYFGKYLNIGPPRGGGVDDRDIDPDTVFDEDAGGYVAVDAAGSAAWAVEGISADEGRRRHRRGHHGRGGGGGGGGRGGRGGGDKGGSPMCGAGGQWVIPRGWDRWLVMCDPGYYHQLWNDQGRKLQGTGAPEDYTTAVIGNATVAWVRNQTRGRAAAGLARRPFFAVVAPHAPHLPSTPAEW